MTSPQLSYWRETNRPLVSLTFVAPLLLAYEAGLLWLGPVAMRNGADVWLRNLLEAAGFGQYFLLPVLTVGSLLGWHHVRRDRWQVRGSVLYGMFIESIAYGGVLLLVAHLHHSVLVVPPTPMATGGTPLIGAAISYLGAGVYEELVFRMIVLTGCTTLLRGLGGKPAASWVVAIVLSSLLFALAHYQVQIDTPWFDWGATHGDLFSWSSFAFRFSAGLLFCLLFLSRGFGIAVGAHALYDILVGC